MAFPIQRSVNFSSANTYAPSVYDKGIIWIKDAYHYLYPKFLYISNLAMKYIVAGLNTGVTFLSSNKTFVIGGVVIGTALFIIYNYWKNRPKLPIVTMESTANLARLSLHALNEKHVPVNATLTFCVDLSDSMKIKGRNEAVKRAINDVLNNAQKTVNNPSSEVNIEMAIVGFNDNSKVIAEPFKLLRTQRNEENRVVEEVKKKIKNLVFSGSTEIIAGLTEASSQLESMAKGNKSGSHTLVLLTDGEQTLKKKELLSIQSRLASNKVMLFAIGIGKHDRGTLQKITSSTKDGFRGIYIDTTEKETIESAVSKAYSQTISSFNDLVLTAPKLRPGTWSVINTPIVTEKDQSQCFLGSLAEEENLVKIIKIHGDQLQAPLDLSSVTFKLSFTDPKGRPGEVLLPWNPNTILNPDILLAGN